MLKKFPRVEVHIRPDIRTTGKALEFLISLVDTKWFVMVDADIELSPGWYDGMLKVAGEYDVIESSKRVMAYHFYREDPAKLGAEARSFDLCHMAKKSAMQGYRCEDDYMWRYTDILLRQAAEKSNYKYGKVDSVFHVHNETERILYKSDEEKNFSKIAWSEPKVVILDKEKEALSRIKNAKAVVKYLDPRYPMVKNDKEYDQIIKLLDRKWISANGPAWLERYDRVTSTLFLLKKFIIIQIAGMRKRLR
jgi:glycosyltransferase involved in cell wall biosynthesis